MLAIYRRHSATCGQTSRRYRRCACPIWVQGTLGGEEVRKALNLTSWDAAEKLIHTWKEGGTIGAEGRKQVSVPAALEAFLRDAAARLKPSTVELYRDRLEPFAAFCSKKNIKRVTDVTIEKLREYREGWTCAPTTAARRIDQLRIFFGFCLDSGWVQRNPAKLLKAPEVSTVGKEPFEAEEVTRIFDACGKLVTRGTWGKDNVKRVRAFIYILRYTGLRISDAASLRVSDVKDGKVLLRTEKTGTLVWIPIPDYVVQALEEVPRVGNQYFQTGNAKPKTVRGGWDRSIRTILKLAKVNHGSAHSFRSTLAVDLLNKGVPVEMVATILGNSPAIVLRHYAPYVRSRQVALETAIRNLWEEPERKPALRVIQGGA
jgi:integrase/recombinase XerC